MERIETSRAKFFKLLITPVLLMFLGGFAIYKYLGEKNYLLALMGLVIIGHQSILIFNLLRQDNLELEVYDDSLIVGKKEYGKDNYNFSYKEFKHRLGPLVFEDKFNLYIEDRHSSQEFKLRLSLLETPDRNAIIRFVKRRGQD